MKTPLTIHRPLTTEQKAARQVSADFQANAKKQKHEVRRDHELAALVSELTAQSEFSDDFAVTCDILIGNVAQQTATLSNHAEQSQT